MAYVIMCTLGELEALFNKSIGKHSQHMLPAASSIKNYFPPKASVGKEYAQAISFTILRSERGEAMFITAAVMEQLFSATLGHYYKEFIEASSQEANEARADIYREEDSSHIGYEMRRGMEIETPTVVVTTHPVEGE